MTRPEYAQTDEDRAERKAAYEVGYAYSGKRSMALAHASAAYDHVLAHNFMRGYMAHQRECME